MLPAGVSCERPLSESEKEDVRRYLAECLNGQGAIGLMYKYLVHLSTYDNRHWPAGVPQLYCMVYERLHPHLTFPSLLCVDFPEMCYTEMAKMTLVWCELTLDIYLASKADCMVSPAMTQRAEEEDGTVSSPFMTDSAMFDLYFVTGMVERGHVDVLGDQASNFTIRVYWNKARLAMADSAMEKAVENLETVVYCLEQKEEPKVLYLPNCTQDKLISLEEVKRQQESLQRCQSLEEIQRLFEARQYRQVVDYLTPTFTQSHAVRSRMKSTLPDPERHIQLEILMDALFRLQDLGHCLVWGEVALDEALHHYRRSPTVPTRDSWAQTLVRLFHGLQRVMDLKQQALNFLTPRTSVRFAQNLMRIIEINHDVSDSVTEMPISSVLPWTLLYRVIKHEEEKLNALKLPGSESQGEIEGAISSSLMLLSVGHEYLGRHAWCTKDRGFFLLFYMEVLAHALAHAHESIKEDLETAFEQCVFCLYSHPNKKGKARHLFDHNVTPIDLTWERCEVVFDYFRPKTVPDFDSYKTSTVGAELENLLRRIYDVIPESHGPGKCVDQIQEYIDGTTNVPPNFSTDNPILQKLYYLLADYYFKNKEPPKAIKFYTYDICFNSWRLDSWAGLALAKNYQIEQKLNSMELKIDNPIHRKSIAALRCFSRAVEIDESVRKLWIEYGALAYQLHSHASRQLRMQSWFPLTPELLEIAMETRVEMLSTARNCYWKASECEAEGSEEEWLHHYMMGKVMEKKRAHPRTYLEHYKQAALYLHEEEATYPRKINYQHSPPHLALEALEMYYRLHMAVMKYLLRVSKPETRDDMTLFDRYVSEATESPFARRREKRVELRESLSSADDVESQSSVASIPPYSTVHQKPVYHIAPLDHTYSKQKSSGGDTSDASYSVRGETLTETDGSQSAEEVDTLTASEIQSQESAEDEDRASAAGRAGKGREATKRDTAVGGKDGKDVRDKDGMGTEMVELHAETNSQVMGDFVDTKPLLFDKQMSGGFEPIVDTRMGSAHSAPLTLTKKDSTGYEPIHAEVLSQKAEQTRDTPPSQILASDAFYAMTGDKSTESKSDLQASTAEKNASGTVAENTEEKDGQPTSMEVDAKGSLLSEAAEKFAVASVTPTVASSDTDAGKAGGHIKPPPDVTKSTQKAEELTKSSSSSDESPVKADNQHLSVITVSSQESGEMSQEEDFSDSVSIHTSSSVTSLSDDNSDAAQSRTASHKRPLQPENQPSKRPRVELFREEKNTTDTKDEVNTKEIKVEETEVACRLAGPSKSEDMPPLMAADASESAAAKEPAATVGQTASPEAQISPSGKQRDSEVKSASLVEGVESKSLLMSSGTDVSVRTSTAAVKTETNLSEDQPSSKSVEGEVMTEDASRKTLESATKGDKPEVEEKSTPPEGDDKGQADKGQGSGDKTQTAVPDVEMLDASDGKKPSSSVEAKTPGATHASKMAGVSENAGAPEDNESTSKEKENTAEKEQVPTDQEVSVQSASKEDEKASASGKAQVPSDSAAKPAADKDTGKTADGKDKDAASHTNQKAQTTVSEPKEKATSQPSNSTVTAADNKATATPVTGTKTTAASPSGTDSDKTAVLLGESEFREWKVRLLDKCVAALHVCLSRFPTHYKSLHRLAYLYYSCESHRNLEFARDLLLGSPDWQNFSHMPANGLFADRRANNFFQGTWKIPIEEIDRSGSFASHINRSVQLLLDVLRDLGDVRMLLSLHTQLRKKPDQGRKYLRDPERQILARMAHVYVLDAVAKQLERPESEVDKAEVLLNAYRAYSAHRNGIDAHRATMLLISAYRWLGLVQHEFGSLVELAVQYCTALIASQAQASTPKGDRSRTLSSSYQASTPTETTSTGVGTTPLPPFPPMSAGPPASTPHTTPLPASGTRLPSAGLPPIGGNFPASSGGRLPALVVGNTPQSPSAGMYHSSGLWSGGDRGSLSSPGVRQPPATLASSAQLRGPLPSHSQMSSGASVHSTARPAHTGTSPSHSSSLHARSQHSLPTHASHTSLPAHSSHTSVPAHTSHGPSSQHARNERPGNAHFSRTSLPTHTSAPSIHAHSLQGKPHSEVRGFLGDLKSKAAPSGAALDLSSPKKQPISMSSPRKQPISGVSGSMSGPAVIDLTSPEKNPEPIPSGSRPPHSLPTVSTPGRSHPHPPAWSTASHVTPASQRGRHPSSPFSSPHYPSSISAATTPPTPRRPTADDVTDIDLTSDPGDDLALTSPDKLTSDIRHHFQGDLP